jgi:multidrug efflux pump subunit AcrA (membrane-fusion protein)
MATRVILRTAAIGGVVALTAGAWFAGRQVQSPNEAAATAQPPTASRITAAAEERVLESTVIVRGIVRYGDPRPVALAASAIKAGGTAASAQIVSTPAEKGAELAEGTRALVVAGRPVFVLTGELPASRDLRPGDTGDDVRQLEASLERLGFEPGAVDGRYDAQTERAVERWYEKAGYTAFGPTDAQRTQLRTLRDAVAKADDAVASANRALSQAERALGGDKLLSAQENVTAAREKTQTAADEATRTAERNANEVAARQDALVLAQKQVELADAAVARATRDATDNAVVADAEDAAATTRSQLRQAQVAVEEALAQVPLAEGTVADARSSITQARDELERTKKTNPTTISEIGVILVQDNASLVRQAEASVRSAEAALRQAEANLAAATRTVDARRSNVGDAERAVTKADASIVRAKQTLIDRAAAVQEAEQKAASARTDLARAERELTTAEETVAASVRSGDVTVRQARAAERIAAAQLNELRNPADVASATAQLVSAQESRKRSAAELNELEEETGIVVPANELLFFPTLPLRVDDVKALRGDVVSGPVMTVTTARLAVDSSVDTAEAKLIKQGAKVSIEASEFDVALVGAVTEIATTAGTKGVDPGKVYLEVTPRDGQSTGGVSAADLNGSSVKLTIPITSTGTAVLAVPVAAVSVGADGSARIEVEDDPAQPTRIVAVRTGLSAEGMVAVTPLEGSLEPGDQVVTGNRDGTAIEGAVEPQDTSDGSADTTVVSAP